jgi:phosphatidylserine/phosphatidylglycerophosphate/cardiolipin synthase-like enzyme
LTSPTPTVEHDIELSLPSRPHCRAASVASNAAIAVCFSPEEDCAAFALRAIDNAEREILVGGYGLTTGSGIVEALVRAAQRGVDGRLIADKTTP